MRPGSRPITAVALTAGGLIALLRFHTPTGQPTQSVAGAAAALPAPSTPAAVAMPTGTRPWSPATTGPSPMAVHTVLVPGRNAGGNNTTPRARATSAGSSRAPQPIVTYNCQAFAAGTYGQVQVQIKVRGDHWADVVNLRLPSGDSETNSLSAYAGPRLRQEALRAESADIDNVSGATYTVDAYRESLQSCIDQW